MPEIQSPDPGRKLQERYNLIGTTPAPFLSPELVPVVLVDDLTEEDPGIRFAAVGFQIAAAAGTPNQVALRNPIGSNVIIENILVSIGASNAISWQVFEAGGLLSIAIVPAWADRRIAGRPAGRVTGQSVATTATGIRLGQGFTPANTSTLIDLRTQKLNEDARVHFETVTLNFAAVYQLSWSERPVTV